ncbi:tetraacyldisaccharide 4'-kinase [Tichowtungia aerotolerans]|uniref:Tetraacyldisaccharide 4'-kinase n=1 Tax=Tichowtungia aerotolerans TaxID=2697043 RepID=A0A6P1M1V3_9BACT|nr:tetraacyldisaccharide 4'-kinase [Tichowtungia aerotolerans]QHI68092.1 tetraacyldisaccharide 4'-kinase [Tichowtungia aerotolerans]
MTEKPNERLEQRLLKVISKEVRGKRVSCLRGFLRGLSCIFYVLVQLRLWLHKHRIIRAKTLGCQVISVGNVTVGGTGKTPIVETFSRSLQQKGRKVAILSRGYKSRKTPFWDKVLKKNERLPRVVSDGERLLLNSELAGDEPYMLASNLPEVAVVVDKDRVKAGKYAIRKLGCDTLVLDDGFQYLKLQNRLDIVLVDYTNPFGYGNVLPRGLLREPARNIKRAGFIFITKCPPEGAPELKAKLREMNPHAEISECRHTSKYLQNVYTREQLPLEALNGRKVSAVSGIAVPESFENGLRRLGAEIVHSAQYADHHRYSQQEIIETINQAAESGAEMILTTEKDAVRFPRIERCDLPVIYLRVEIEMLSGSDAFNDWIDRICFR